MSTMTLPRELRTARLVLRRWLATDRAPFASMNADHRVMEHFPAVLGPDESNGLADRIGQHFDNHRFGLWAVEIPGVTRFAGFVGLAVPEFHAHFTPCVEVGWRLAAEYWGRGYATEGGRAAVVFGFERLHLAEVVSFTVPENVRSRHVMERIGMVPDSAADFDHPTVPALRRRHVLYRIKSNELTTPACQPTTASAIPSRRG